MLLLSSMFTILYAYGWVIGNVVRYECDKNSKSYMVKSENKKHEQMKNESLHVIKNIEKKLNVLFIVPKINRIDVCITHAELWFFFLSLCVNIRFCYCHYVDIVPKFSESCKIFQNLLNTAHKLWLQNKNVQQFLS